MTAGELPLGPSDEETLRRWDVIRRPKVRDNLRVLVMVERAYARRSCTSQEDHVPGIMWREMPTTGTTSWRWTTGSVSREARGGDDGSVGDFEGLELDFTSLMIA